METTSFTELTSSDIVIAVMGVTGSGKSKFISHLVDEEVTVGHNLTSCTMNVGIYSFLYRREHRVYLVDTPGFDDTNRSDTDVLKDIAFFLSQVYRHTVKLAGVIYLHRITDNRFPGSGLRNLNMFKKLCGEDAYKHVILATTMWEHFEGPHESYALGVEREQELINRREWWGLMHERGSRTLRHRDNRRSALDIVGHLIELRAKVVLNIQMEMVDEEKTLAQTAAGQEVEKDLQEAKRRFAEQIKELQNECDKALRDRDENLARTLSRQREEFVSKLSRANQAQEELKVNFERLTKEKTAEYQRLLTQLETEQRTTAEILSESQEQYRRFQDERREAESRERESQMKLEKERGDFERRINDLLRKNQEAEAERVRGELRRTEAAEKKLRARTTTERDWRNREEQELLLKVQQLEERQRANSRGKGVELISLMAGVTGVAAAALSCTVM